MSKVIIPKFMIDPARMQRAVINALDGAARGAKADFGVTTRTWEEEVEFTIAKPSTYERAVGTNNRIYLFVNFGYPLHNRWTCSVG